MNVKYTPFLAHKTPSAASVDRLWKGSIDMHIHFAPDPGMERRFDGLETVVAAKDAGMRALVLKSDHCPTIQIAYAAQRAIPEVAVFGSINIETCTTGGLGEYTAEIIETNAKMGAKVLWFPTFGSAFSRKYMGKEGGLTIFNEDGKLIPVVYDILDVVKRYDMVLCSGHMSYEESEALFIAAEDKGIVKKVVTHPLCDVIWPAFTMDQMKRLAELGAYIEHVYRCCLPLVNSLPPERYVEAVREIGADKTIMATDFAQISDTSPAEGMRQFIATMLQLGISEDDITLMVKTNPAKLLDLNE